MYIPDELVKLLLPDFLVEHFDILKAEDIKGVLHIEFEEKNIIPKNFLIAPICLMVFILRFWLKIFP